MKIKKEMLEEATKTSYGDLDLYLSNSSQPKPKEEPTKTQTIRIPMEKREKEERKIEKETPQEVLKMISVRIPEDLLDKVFKYSYVARKTQKDVIVEGIKSIVESDEGKKKIADYEKIKNEE